MSTPPLDAATEALFQDLQAQPRDARRRVRLAVALTRAGAHERAIAVLAEGLAETPDATELLAQHCVALRIGRRFDDADHALVALAAVAPDHPRLHQMRGDLAVAHGDWAAAVEHYAADVAAAPREAYRRTRLAQALYRTGAHERAIAMLAEGLAETPDSPELLAQHCTALRVGGRFDDAHQALVALAAVAPDHPRLHQMRGEVAAARGDWAAAVEHYAADVAAAPREAYRRTRLAQALYRTGAHERAIAVLDEGLAEAPDSSELLAQHCTALRIGGRFDDAHQALVALAAVAPDHPRLHQMRGEVAAARGEWAAAVEHYAADVAAAPREAYRRTRLAQALCRTEAYDRAIAVVSEGLAEAPQSPDLLMQHCVALRLAGRFDEAGAATMALARAQPDHRLLHQMRGDLASARGDLPDAILHYRADAAAAPHEAHRKARLAQALDRAGEHTQSLAMLAEGLQAEPDSPDLLAQTCVTLRLAGQYEDAASAIAALARASPDHPRLHLLRGELALVCGEHVTANAHFRADLLANPKDAGRRMRLSHGLRRIGDLQGALALMDAVQDPSPSERAVRAEILMELGQFDEVDQLLDSWTEDRNSAPRLRVAAQRAALRYDHSTAIDLAEALLALTPEDSRAALFRAKAATFLFQTDRAWEAMGQVAITPPGGGPPRRGRGRLRHLFGQIINEQRLCPEETAVLAAASGAGGVHLAVTAAPFLRDGTENIGPAVALLTGLARAGRLADRADHDPTAAAIPRILHQYWDAVEPPEEVVHLMDHAKAANPGFAYHLWHDATARAFLEKRARPEILRAYRTAKHVVMRADLLRLALLDAEGGVYLDADDLCVGALDRLLPAGSRMVVYQEDFGSIGNNFLAAAPGDPLIAEALGLAASAILSGASETIWLATGPGLISRVVARAIAATPGLALPSGLHIVSLSQFLRVIRPHQRVSYKIGAGHWSRSM
ncbi:tetratricopeptide repeat protein [Humitalea sp. 24SJ18S-53]|uniref:tetratricopeptide repeat protein n=1 Tax=Humitalea sp. 24SJ18S-53 TaxID=3422307 RepID=UPI003D6731DA